jgi:[ribosomal protein S5]-alanine N-acetyltransferase
MEAINRVPSAEMCGNYPLLQTERLWLRPLTDAVYRYVFERYDDAQLMNFFGCSTREELDEERKKHDHGLSMYRKSLLIFQVIEKETGSVIGWCGYHTWYIHHNRAEIGYVLTDESKRRMGYMKEALKETIRFGFNEMSLLRIEAMVGRDNEPSIKLLTNSGFQYEGKLREHYFVNGVMEDSLMYGLLKREYKEA